MKKRSLFKNVLGLVLSLTLIVGTIIVFSGERPQPEIVEIETTYLG